MTDIYRFEITLSHITPRIWRRIDVPADWTLADLSMVIQDAFAWENRHLWEFDVDGARYGFYTEDDPGLMLADEAVLSDALGESDEFTYTYDFGDGWRHEIVLEERLEPEEHHRYPRLVDGGRAAPPEDSGGPLGYMDFFEQREEGTAPPHLVEWFGDFDPEDFDPGAVDLATPWYSLMDSDDLDGLTEAFATKLVGDDHADEVAGAIRQFFNGMRNRNKDRAITYGSHRVFVGENLETYPTSNQITDCLDRLPVAQLDAIGENIGLEDPPSRRGPRARAIADMLDEPPLVSRLLDDVSKEARRLFDLLMERSGPVDIAALVRGGWTRGEPTWLLFDGHGTLAELRRLGLAHLGTYRTKGETRYLAGVPVPVFPEI